MKTFKSKVIIIEGPTASGKSDLAYELASYFKTDIISADSRQVYKYLNIGTAKPDEKILSEVRHHLIDIITPNQRYSVGQFIKEANIIIEKLDKNNKIPIICGGSMLYIDRLLNGLSYIPDVEEKFRQLADQYIKTHSLSECYHYIKSFDPKFSQRIAPTDKQRIHRVLSVWFAFKKPISYYWDKQETICEYNWFRILINKDRDDLYDRINRRTESMIESGLIEEVQRVLDMGYKTTDYGLTSVGYTEFLDLITTKSTLDKKKMRECISLAAQHTRNYAKRQITWYKKKQYDFIVSNQCLESLYDKISRFLDKPNHP